MQKVKQDAALQAVSTVAPDAVGLKVTGALVVGMGGTASASGNLITKGENSGDDNVTVSLAPAFGGDVSLSSSLTMTYFDGPSNDVTLNSFTNEFGSNITINTNYSLFGLIGVSTSRSLTTSGNSSTYGIFIGTPSPPFTGSVEVPVVKQ